MDDVISGAGVRRKQGNYKETDTWKKITKEESTDNGLKGSDSTLHKK